MANAAQELQNADKRIECKICGERTHAIQKHLKDDHPDWTVERYQSEFPGAELFSEVVKAHLESKGLVAPMSTAIAAPVESNVVSMEEVRHKCGTTRAKKAFHEIFGFKANGEAMSTANPNQPIMIHQISKSPFEDMIPDVDADYVLPLPIVKRAMIGIEMNKPVYLWGHAGTGKTTVCEQIMAHTGRPTIRIQHTANTEESHIVGQTLANEKGTYFEPGPLALAMKHGWTYLADEYDFAFPQVLGIYQPVLEGNPLVIKEAPAEWRVIKPHPEFRFIATGNTNGSGDETGLYQGTNLQNSANYSRFGICIEVPYMPKRIEIDMISSKAKILKDDAKKLVDWAADVRTAYKRGDITNTVGPRELINAASVGLVLASFAEGIKLAFSSKLPPTSAEAVDQLTQRYFG